MKKTVVVLSTLDTKGQEADYLREQVEILGGQALLVDIGVIGPPGVDPDVSREQVASAGGKSLGEILENPSRQGASPVMVSGARRILQGLLEQGRIHAVIGLGGTQGTPNCTQVMQALPYGFPKIMVSTVASGDTAPFVDIKDITMMFSVGDILGLNPITRKILANAAAAAYGMTLSQVVLESRDDQMVIGMTNLGVLTKGAMQAIDCFHQAGYEVIVFHAVGSGGRAMEQMMKEGLIGAVFDYALGEITDELFNGLRAANEERLTVAGKLRLPQVICPGGAEHVGVMVAPNQIPEQYKDHRHVFHNPVVFVPRLKPNEMIRVAEEVARRLQHSSADATLMLPLQGTSRYSVPGGPLHDPEGDRVFFEALKAALPKTMEVVERDLGPEDPEFIEEAASRLLSLIERRQ